MNENLSCTRRFQFCAGHRVMGHENKCAHMHGHNYVAHMTVRAEKSLDSIGRIIDFSVLKDVVGTWIDSQWDHGFIVSHADEVVKQIMTSFRARRTAAGSTIMQKLYVMPNNPTAENMAEELAKQAQILLHPYNIIVTKVVLEETENCLATWTCPE